MDNEISHNNFTAILNEETNIGNYKKALQWWIVKKVMMKKLAWLKKAKELVLMRLLVIIKLLEIV